MARSLALWQAVRLTILSFLVFSRWADAAQNVDGSQVEMLADDITPFDVPSTYYTDLHACPAPCGDSSSRNWTVYSSIERLNTCNKTMLLDFSIHAPVQDANTVNKFFVCTADPSVASSEVKALPKTPICGSVESMAHAATEAKAAVLELSTSGADDATDTNEDKTSLERAWKDALIELESFFSHEHSCETPVLFSYANGVAVGTYIGSAFDKSSISHAVKAIQDSDQIKNGLSGTAVAQICGKGRNSEHVLGIAIDTTGNNLASVQKAVASWSKAECAKGLDDSSSTVSIQVWEATTGFNEAVDNSTVPDSTDSSTGDLGELLKRGNCKTKTVHSGDSCGSLAKACGISASKFNKYNPDKKLCSTLVPGQRVCCSSGSLPDIRPKPYKNGTCATHFVQSHEDCSTIAAKYGLKQKDLEKFNNDTDGTWGWTGCNPLLGGINICLSRGDPPIPAPVSNAMCGPTVPGTKMPKNKKDLADLNPCPMKACCNIWGQCGISGQYCEEKRGPSGNPGTAPPKINGCVSSCGTDITNKGDAPDSFQRVGYYESWNLDRSCTNLLAKNADKGGSYTHVHWAFMSIDTSTWKPVLNNTYKQWDDFKGLSAKRIMSFGGWGFSTDPATYDALREAMSSKNRDKFADNIVKFIKDEGIDGVDIDWEYPGAPDIPGIPPGQKDDGAKYLKFLSTLRSKLPKGKTMSIAAPASYWYLKSFPIDKMADELDFIVYMTYDLHGQWDVGNKYAVDGCPGGNCLRSHVNLTETHQALAMITKAGVPTNKIMVGEVSYGRSFLMSQKGCTSANCTFVGDRDDLYADTGSCTQTAGYISTAEINDLIAAGKGVKTYYDKDSASDIVIYNEMNWAAHMTTTTKNSRIKHWQGYNFLGTIDWAVHLQDSSDDGTIDIDDNGKVQLLEWDSWDPKKVPANFKYGDCDEKSYDTLEDLANDSSTDKDCRPFYVLQYLQKNLTDSLTEYDKLIKDDYDDKFKTYSKAVVDGAPKDVDDFVKGHGDKYFTCKVTETQWCCDKCDIITKLPGACTYCFKDDDCETDSVTKRDLHVNRRFINESFASDLGWTSSNTGLQILDARQVVPPPAHHYKAKYSNISEPCPPDYSKRGMGRGQPQYDTVYWTLPENNHDKFFADLYSEVGIREENIKFTDRHNAGGCIPPSESWAECRLDHWDVNIPVPDGYGQDDVLNPKDVISDAHGRIKGLPDQLKDAISGLQKGGYGYNVDDLVDALSLPVFMVSDALQQMQTIVDVADEIEKEKRKAIILAFLSAILFFVPVAGEIAGSVAALAGIARIISLIGAAGDAAMDIYTIVDDPKNAPLAIFNLVLAPLALGDIAVVSRAASTRRGMSEDSIAKLGGSTSKRLGLIDVARGISCRK